MFLTFFNKKNNYKLNGKSIELTPNDFNEQCQLKNFNNQIVLIKFYAPWCHYCKLMKNDYEQVAQIYNKSNSNIIIAELDCQKYPEIQAKMNSFANGPKIPGYPSLLLYKNNLYFKTYEDIRKANNIIKFINENK